MLFGSTVLQYYAEYFKLHGEGGAEHSNNIEFSIVEVVVYYSAEDIESIASQCDKAKRHAPFGNRINSKLYYLSS